MPVADEDPWADPDDTTDLSNPRLGLLPSPWALNKLGRMLLAALAVMVIAFALLAFKIHRLRQDLLEAEAAADQAAAAAARDDSAAAEEPASVAADSSATPAGTAGSGAAAAGVAAKPGQAPARDRLVLLLTVGMRPYAEKQLKHLRAKCPARLAVYEQIHGRCRYARCYSIAAPESDQGLSRGCGQVKGQSLRDRADFRGL
ncbi:MAG: hypothetical protein JST92_18035 [Deltaproteobacteria bacterium]|nr:hypothetical protein [Deltaproteobacteria bacterium]